MCGGSGRAEMSDSVIDDDVSTLPDETKREPLSLSSQYYPQSTPTHLRGQPQWVEDVCLILGRLFSLVALILVIFWAHGSDTSRGFLGGLNWKDNVFNFHPVMMIASFFFTGWSITAYRIKSISMKYKKYLHLFAHILAKICLTIGLRAVYVSKRDNDDYHYHLLSLHTWLGTLTAILLIQNDFFGAITFVFPFLSRHIQKFYRPYHIFFGKMAFIFLVMTIETGIMEENTFLVCSPSADKVDNSPGSHYLVIPSGCRLSSGLGLVIALAMLFLIFALRNQRSNQYSDHRDSVTTTGVSLVEAAIGGRESDLMSDSSIMTPLPSHSQSSLSKRAISIA
jgi:hypothetical protein